MSYIFVVNKIVEVINEIYVQKYNWLMTQLKCCVENIFQKTNKMCILWENLCMSLFYLCFFMVHYMGLLDDEVVKQAWDQWKREGHNCQNT